MATTKQFNSNDKISTQSMRSLSADELDVWLAQRLKVTRAMFPNSKLTPEAVSVFLSEWANICSEIGQAAFDRALTDAVRESDFFPSIALIRRCAGITGETQAKCEADAAWDLVQAHIRKWFGLPGARIFKGRDPQTGALVFEKAPSLPERVEYAVRAVGGLHRIANVRDDSEPFMRKDFAEAFARSETAFQMEGQLPEGIFATLRSAVRTLPSVNEASDVN